MAKKSGGAGLIGAAVLGVLVLIASVPKEVWIGIGVLAVIGFVLYQFAQSKRPPALLKNGVSRPDGVRSSAPSIPNPTMLREPADTTYRSDSSSDGFRIPAAPAGYGSAKWVPPGESIRVAGLDLPGGMLYVGSKLPTPRGVNDPCLIDPSKSVASKGDYTERQMGYWPSYSDITPSARRAYLNWLADGRRNPEADIGFVFLFFYGLERRAIVDASKLGDKAANDWPWIAKELGELIRVYSPKSGSFNRYACELLSWVQLATTPTKLYERPVPELARTYELPLYLRLALGQAALDGVPVPPAIALAWARLAPDAYLRTPAIRCADEFERLFTLKYTQAFGAGMTLPRNKTKLKFVYRPASSGFQGYDEIRLSFGEVPDVSVLTAPINKLRPLVEAATKELESYSRFVGKNPEARSTLEGHLQLPATLWPQSAQNALQGLNSRMADGMLTLSFQELLAILEAKTALTKDKIIGLARALESMNIAMEPDVLAGAKVPKPEDKLVLFTVPPGEQASRATAPYQAAMVTLQLASTVASADGEFGATELGYLRQQIQAWSHVTPNHQRRLVAHLQLLATTPASLPALKKSLEPLGQAAKETIASFMATVAHADGTVTPAEIKMLEKVYKALGVESTKVFSDVHSAASGSAPAQRRTGAPVKFALDPARIAALQKDSEKVSALLTDIFAEEEALSAPAAPAVELETEAAVARPEGLLGLDEAHCAFARMLLSRPEWSRAELMDVTSDLDLMLDGALEQLNDAALDKLEVVFTEGDDPVKINNEVLEKIQP